LKGAGSKRTALRSLYILRDFEHNHEPDNHSYGHRLSLVINNKQKKNKKRKKIWIVTTHLDAATDSLQQVQQIHAWMSKAQTKICKAPIIICGDFNCAPSSKVYEFMTSKGYKSVAVNDDEHSWTYPTKSWKYQRNAQQEQEDEENEEKNDDDEEEIQKDYIWIKNADNSNICVDEVRLVGRQYIDSTHKGEKIKIYPSDHLGIYCKLSV